MDKIDVVIVTYNRLLLLKECISALMQQQQNISNIFIVNNNSQDGTKKYLADLAQNTLFQINNLEENVGGAMGFETGISMAMHGRGKYVLIMDDDTIPTVSATEALLKAKDTLDGNFGFLCSNVKWKDGSGMNFPDPVTEWTTLADKNLIRVKSATFVSLMINKAVINKVGLPIGEMKIWGDDTEFTTRLSTEAQSYFVANSVVIHKSPIGYSNTGILRTGDDRVWRLTYSYRNRIYICKKFDSKKRLFKLVIKSFFDAVSCFRIKSKKFQRANNVISGTVKGLFFNPKVKFPD